MKGLHDKIKKQAQTKGVKLSELKPNSREIAQRLINQGALHNVGGVYRWSGD
jgi:hypothetical protein